MLGIIGALAGFLGTSIGRVVGAVLLGTTVILAALAFLPTSEEFPTPEILLSSIYYILNYSFAANEILPIDTVWRLFTYWLFIELFMWIWIPMSAMMGWVLPKSQ